MARFTSKLIVEDDGGFPFTLVYPLAYESDRIGSFVVPAGFKTDFASIPRVLWNLLPPVGRYDAAAVLHDYLYQRPSGAPKVTRSIADHVLLEAMDTLRVILPARVAIFAGVRLGGWLVWNNYRRKD